MIERLDFILGAFEDEDGSYAIYELSPVIFSKNMKPTKSKGASSGRVGIGKKNIFEQKGKHLHTFVLD